MLHPNEVVLVRRNGPTKAFSEAVADLYADPTNIDTKREALNAQIIRQKATLTPEVTP